MVDADEWDWIVEHAHGSFDHLVVVTTLPAFAPPGIHHLEAWNEAVCDGCWGSVAARLGERLRRAVDLEHWAAFQRSFEQLVDLLRAISRGLGGEPPATITILSGDVHTSYLAEVDLSQGAGSSRVYQVVCSPFRNPLKQFPRRVVKATGSRRSASVFSRLARLCGVAPPSATWKYVAPRTYENSIGELQLDGPSASVTIYEARASGEAGTSLERLHTHQLSAGPVAGAAEQPARG